MDAKQFLAEFGHIAGAPGGVQRLRNLILSYAIQGKLSNSQESDTDVSNIIFENEGIRKALVEKGELRKKHKPTEITNKDAPWLIPPAWGWFRLGALTNYGDSQKVLFDDVAPETWVLELEDIEKAANPADPC